MLRLRTISDGLTLSIDAPSELARILSDAGFDIVAVDNPIVSDQLLWQLYSCHHNGAIVSVSFAQLADKSNLPLITVNTCRTLLYFWIRPNDRRLVQDVAAILRKKQTAITNT